MKQGGVVRRVVGRTSRASALGAAVAAAAALARPCEAQSLIDTSTVSGHYSASHFYTHFANGYYWAAFNKDNLASLYRSADGVSWTSLGAIFPYSIPEDSNNWAVRYRGNRIVAMIFNTGDNTRYYREGTLGSSGTVTWGAAPAAAGPADAANPALNALIANSRPVMWRAAFNANGAFWRGSALSAPAWAALPGVVPAHGMSTGFTAGAIFQTGGGDPDDLVVLRTFTQAAYSAGNHRLLALKWNDVLGAYDGSWYNVSTLGGTLTEDTSTEVLPGDDFDSQRKFTAVADAGGDIHAFYVTRQTRVAHYRKAVGFNNSWTRVTSDVLAGDGASKVAASATANGQVLLFYEKNTTQRNIWMRRFDGTTWSAETLVYPGASLGTDLRRALAPLELALGCMSGVAFTTGTTPPFNVSFSLAGDCHGLIASAAGTQVTLETPEVRMVWEGGGSGGGGLAELYGRSEPNPGVSRSGYTDNYNVFATQINDVDTGSTWHFEGHDGATGNRPGRLEVLEVTGTRARLRQRHDYTPTIHLLRDWSVYAEPRLVLDETLSVDVTQDIRGAQGLHPRGDVCGGTFYCAGISDLTNNIWVATDDAATYSDMLGIPYAAPFFGRAGAGPSWNNNLEGGTPSTWLARVHEGTHVSTAAGDHTRYYMVYPYLAGLTSGGTQWQPYASAYRVPSSITMLTGQRWLDASENTGGADDFNEAEAAYPFTLDPVNGLRFRIDGSIGSPRHQPFFKIRQWRSLAGPPNVTLDGASLAPNLDYRADVKPVSRAYWATTLTYHSTLQDQTAVVNADVGTGGFGGGIDPAGFGATGKYGQGVLVNNSSHYLFSDSASFNQAVGAIEFWFQPATNHTDGTRRVFWLNRNASDYFLFEKTAANDLLLTVLNTSGGQPARTVTVSSANYSWRAGDWVHLKVLWNDVLALGGDRLQILVNGQRPTHAGPVTFSAASMNKGITYYGSCAGGACPFGGSATAGGVFDEISVYIGGGQPTAVAHGGLLTDSREYLASTSLNWSFNFTAVDGSRRGMYLFLGADSTFHGLNVALLGAGTWSTPGDLVWEYWNGTAWATLESGLGFGDTTQHLTRSGNVYWTGDPSGWSPYSIDGGPDLYYVRVYLASGGAYASFPQESRISTDVLLVQYCGSITATGQEFFFGPPVTTEVTLQSFVAAPADASVLLSWRTASELRNLGFHLYRGLSADGPWQRLTASLIPGLGSSAVGKDYSFLDGGLANGTLYYYRLEDVDASSRATSHGPVSAAPVAGAPDDRRDGTADSDGGRREADSAPGCPGWVLAAYGSSGGSVSAGSLRCTRQGNPEAVSLRELSRDSRSATVELSTGGFYALHEPSGTVRAFVPGFDLPQGEGKAALPYRRALVEAVVGRRVELGGVRATDVVSFRGLTPSALGEAEMEVGFDGTVRAGRRSAARRAVVRREAPRLAQTELVKLLPSQFQGEKKSAVVEIAPLRYDERRRQLVLAKTVRLRLLFTGREPGESGRGNLGRAPRAGKPAVTGEVLARLHTTSRGLHAVAFEELLPGQRRGVSVSGLRLERQGEAVAFHVEPATSSFGPGSRLYFHADETARSTDYSAEVAYELVSSREGMQMPLTSAAPGPDPLTSPSSVRRVFETNRFYQPGLLEAPDPWLWEAATSGATRAVVFSLAGVSASGSAELMVDLQGASESGQAVDHHVSVAVNGTLVGQAQFAGKKPYRTSLSLPASLLREGTNELSLTNVGDTGVTSLVFLDRFMLVHPQRSSAADGRFEGAWPESGTATVSGVSGAPAVVELSASSASGAPGSPLAPRWLSGSAAVGDTLRFQAEAGRTYLVVSEPLSPRVSRPEPPTLRATANQADYLLITPRAFLAAAEPLVARRQDQGLSARAVPFEEIASEFGHGQPSAEAIREFLSYAFQSWTRPSPRYVLLLGDASYDPRNFSGVSQPSPLPALWTKTSYLWTASDPLLGAVNGEDGLPDLAIGRLPATTLEQAEALVQKLLAWEDSGQGLAGAATLVADNPDLAGDFEADVEDIRASFLADRETRVLKLGELGAAVRPRVQEALDGGLSYLNYVGHGGAAVWASENVWNSWDAASLQAQSQQPLLVTMNCLNGYFVAPSFESLSESLIKAEGRGALASFSPSGLSLDGPAHQYHRALMGELTSSTHARLGDAVLAAQKTYAETGLMPELLAIYHLLGDPAMPIR